MASAALNRDKVVFRDTAARIGRHISVTPATSATTHLSYGRIRLDRTMPGLARKPLQEGLHFADQPRDLRFRNRLPVDLNALGETDQVGRSV